MSVPVLPPYLQPTGVFGQYWNTETNQLVCMPAQLRWTPQFTSLPQRNSDNFTPNNFTSNNFTSSNFTSSNFTSSNFTSSNFTSSNFTSSNFTSNSFTPNNFTPQGSYAGSVQLNWNGPNHYQDTNACLTFDSRLEPSPQVPLLVSPQEPPQEPQEPQESPQLPFQQSFQRSFQQWPQQHYQHQHQHQHQHQEQQGHQQGQAWSSTRGEVIDLDELQERVASELPSLETAPQAQNPVIDLTDEVTFQPPKKGRSFLAERLNYLKANIHEGQYPIEIRLLRTFENMDLKQGRKYCTMFWPTNEAALEDLHEMAKLSPVFTEIYMHRMAWEAAAQETDQQKIEEEQRRIEHVKEKLRKSCREKYKGMLEDERFAQALAVIGTTKGNKGAAARAKQLEVFWEQENEKRAYENMVAMRKRDRQLAAQEKSTTATRQEEQEAAATQNIQEAESRRRNREEDELANDFDRSTKVPRVEIAAQAPSSPAEDEDDFEALLAGQLIASFAED
ncbi:Nn.00g002150.m01.CDS01 [Neocucurbitaria sp. VM-36]